MIDLSEKLSCSLRFVGMLLLCSLCAIVLASPATADTVYTYTGNPFTFFIPPDACTEGVGECQISLSFTLASALPANFGLGFGGSVTLVTPLSFSITDGVHTLAQFNSTASFFVGTTPSGQIDLWSIFGSTPFGQPNFSLSTLNATFFRADSTDTFPEGAGAANFNNPGTWTTSTVPRVPEPSSLFLLGTGLLGIATGLQGKWRKT